jgi:hypothetical protein
MAAIQVEVYVYRTIRTKLGDMTVVNETDATGKVVAQWFPVRDQCEMLGLDAGRQKRALHEHYEQALRRIPLQLKVGWRDVLCIHRQELALWLGGIDPSRCKLAAGMALEDYRRDLLIAADQLLWKHISIGSAAVATQPLQVETHVEVRSIAACPCCGKPTRVAIYNGETVLTHLEEE